MAYQFEARVALGAHLGARRALGGRRLIVGPEEAARGAILRWCCATGAQDGMGTAGDISKYADYTSKALGAASFIPGVGELAAPAAGVAAHFSQRIN